MYFQIENLTVRFGGLTAVDSVSFDVGEKQIVSLVGPNGAGKTTIFNALTGFGPFAGGAAHFKGQNILGLPPVKVARLGMTRTFQKTHIFNGLSVLDNIVTASNMRFRSGFWANLLGLPCVKREEQEFKERALATLDLFGLLHLKDLLADNLSYGDARFLEVAIAYASEAEFLLLDEPAAGLNPVETDRLMEIINTINRMGKTILLIEHDMKMVMSISNHIVVVNFGKKIAAGGPEEIANNPEVIAAYLGSKKIHAQDNLITA